MILIGNRLLGSNLLNLTNFLLWIDPKLMSAWLTLILITIEGDLEDFLILTVVELATFVPSLKAYLET